MFLCPFGPLPWRSSHPPNIPKLQLTSCLSFRNFISLSLGCVFAMSHTTWATLITGRKHCWINGLYHVHDYLGNILSSASQNFRPLLIKVEEKWVLLCIIRLSNLSSIIYKHMLKTKRIPYLSTYYLSITQYILHMENCIIIEHNNGMRWKDCCQ
jgi:hypothetical protein